jgi:hypothetical protein
VIRAVGCGVHPSPPNRQWDADRDGAKRLGPVTSSGGINRLGSARRIK